MAKYIIDESTLREIANAIRSATGETKQFRPSEMAIKAVELKNRISELENQSGGPVSLTHVLINYCRITIFFTEGTTWGEIMDGSGLVLLTYCDMDGTEMFYQLTNDVLNDYLFSAEEGVYFQECPNCGSIGGYICDPDGNYVFEGDPIIPSAEYGTETPIVLIFFVDGSGEIYDVTVAKDLSFGDLLEVGDLAHLDMPCPECGEELRVYIENAGGYIQTEGSCEHCGYEHSEVSLRNTSGEDIPFDYIPEDGDEFYLFYDYYPGDYPEEPTVYFTLIDSNGEEYDVAAPEGLTLSDLSEGGEHPINVPCRVSEGCGIDNRGGGGSIRIEERGSYGQVAILGQCDECFTGGGVIWYNTVEEEDSWPVDINEAPEPGGVYRVR